MEDSNDAVKKSLDVEEQEIPNSHPLGEQEIIDPHLLRNVDGPPRQRKGSSRFSKKQKSKSPGGGARSSYSESEGLSESEGDEESDSFHRPKRTSKVIVGRLVLKEEVVQESWSSQQAANCVTDSCP